MKILSSPNSNANMPICELCRVVKANFFFSIFLIVRSNENTKKKQSYLFFLKAFNKIHDKYRGL